MGGDGHEGRAYHVGEECYEGEAEEEADGEQDQHLSLYSWTL